MYRCNDCYEIFDEPESERVDMEEYYGVGGLFGNHHHEYMSVCPFCKSTDFEEYLEDEDEEGEEDELK